MILDVDGDVAVLPPQEILQRTMLDLPVHPVGDDDCGATTP